MSRIFVCVKLARPLRGIRERGEAFINTQIKFILNMDAVKNFFSGKGKEEKSDSENNPPEEGKRDQSNSNKAKLPNFPIC